MTTMRVLRVIARREGFRRVGLVFGETPRDVPLDALSASQRASIERDPMLLATEVEIAVAPEDQTEVPPEGAGQAGGGEASDINPGVRAAAAPATGRKRK